MLGVRSEEEMRESREENGNSIMTSENVMSS